MTRVVALLMACIALASCSTTMESISEKVIDSTPAWMGGLPKDAPPRLGTPEYDEFRRKQEAELTRDKSHDPMYGPAVRRKRISSIWRMCGLASMYPASDWSAFVLPAIMDISARAISLPDRPRTGHLGHQWSRVPGRPILHLVSSSRRPRRVTGVGATSSIAPHLAQFLCSCLKAVPSSRPAGVPRRRAQGPARLAVALLCLTF